MTKTRDKAKLKEVAQFLGRRYNTIVKWSAKHKLLLCYGLAAWQKELEKNKKD